MRLVLDTVTFIWAITTPERLSRAAMSALRKATAVREISVVSLMEIAIKQIRGTLTFGEADAVAGAADLRLRVLPYAAGHSYHLFDLPTHHADPFDRQIIARALVENIPIVTNPSPSTKASRSYGDWKAGGLTGSGAMLV